MLFVSSIVVGLLVGWGTGRLLAPTSAGVAGDLAWGMLGSVSVAWVMQAIHQGPAGGSLEVVFAGVAGALMATLVHRAYADRFRSLMVRGG